MEEFFTLKDVLRVYPGLSYRSVQTWVKRGVILPMIPPKGQGAASRFNYLNLIEIGLVAQLGVFGYDTHFLLAKFMKAMKSGKYDWIDSHNYDWLFVIRSFKFINPSIMGRWEIMRPADFQMAGSAALVVDIRLIKAHVDQALA
jgi:hypothetical protein